jgi:hypothetical protein
VSRPQYAVSLVGLLNVCKQPEHLPLYWLLENIVTTTVVAKGHTLGTEALVVRDDVSAERWEAIVKVVQMKFRPAAFPLYENAGKGWRRISERRQDAPA